jgi:hypothetical protein
MKARTLTLDQKMLIVGKLYHLRLARKIPPIYVDNEVLRIEIDYEKRRLTWQQAARLANGTKWQTVMHGRT